MGANDGTRLLQLTDSCYRDYRPSVHLGMTLFQDRCVYSGEGLWAIQLAWLGVCEAGGEAPVYSDCDYDEGGIRFCELVKPA